MSTQKLALEKNIIFITLFVTFILIDIRND